MRFAILCALTATGLVACGSHSGSGGGGQQKSPANTLTPAEFHAKAASGDDIFKDLKAVPANFGGQQHPKMLFSSALASAANPVPDKIDVNSAACRKDGDATTLVLSTKTYTTQSYACQVLTNGKLADWTVVVTTDQDGNELKRSQSYAESTADESGNSTQAGDNADAASYLPRADAVDDCASAFELFQSLFAQAQTDYDQLTAELKSASEQGENGLQLTAVTPAADESVAYELKPQDGNPGLTLTGRVAGGGTDTALTLKRSVDMTMDFAKMTSANGMPADASLGDLGVQKIAASDTIQLDLNARKVVATIDLAMTETANGQTQSQAVRGSIEVSDGADKYVRQALTVSLGADASQTFATDLTARLVDANTLTIAGTYTGAGKPGSISYKVTKNAAGVCAVAK